MPLAAAVLTLRTSGVGLALVAQAFLNRHDGPLMLDAIGALAAAVLAVFTARE